jgi:hypothetical protein
MQTLSRQVQEAEAEQGSVEDTGAASEADSAAKDKHPRPTAKEQPEGDKTEKTLEQKYKTLQGMYNAEVPRLHADKAGAYQPCSAA